MSQRIRLTFAILLACSTFAVAEKQESWLEVRSPHFVVVTNANEKNGRRIADQFERMRSVFHVAFPKLQIDPNAPIVVLAIKDDKDFRALEPEAYLAKGSLKLGGLFLRAPEKNYVLMRVGAEGEHPYSVIYHEYTHLLTSNADWMPLWMNEGLAEFYQNTDILDKYVALGQTSSENIMWLRQNRLLPLPTLFAVDHNSPYYHEENKGSIFYAQSWALMHYLQVNDFQNKTQRIAAYGTLLAQNVDPVTAASRAFGDLGKLQKDLENYISFGNYSYFKMPASTEVDDSAFKVQPLPPPQADAVRADFLAYNQRFSDSQTLLDHVLQADPNNTLAHETEGFLAFREGHLGDAKKWYKQAVQLDSQSYLANYYYAVMAMSDSGAGTEDDAIESSLRAAIKLNPSFGPAFDRLAVFLGMRHKNLDEARMMALNAVSLEPSNVFYRVNVANVYMEMQKGKNAVAVLHAAAKLAKKPAEVQLVDNALMHAQE
jgi:tetratricopeptide (TPR) repeat protein